MATFWERPAHLVDLMFPMLCLFVALVVSHFGFEGRTLVLIASVSGHSLPRKNYAHSVEKCNEITGDMSLFVDRFLLATLKMLSMHSPRASCSGFQQLCFFISRYCTNSISTNREHFDTKELLQRLQRIPV